MRFRVAVMIAGLGTGSFSLKSGGGGPKMDAGRSLLTPLSEAEVRHLRRLGPKMETQVFILNLGPPCPPFFELIW